MIKEAIIKLSQKQNLTYEEAEQVMDEIMEGKATDVQKSAYLTALSMKGETIDEITASAAGRDDRRDHGIRGGDAFPLRQTAPQYGCAGDRWNRRGRGEFF